MSGWGNGYVTDIGYMAQYYVEQSPHLLAAACLIAGYEPGFDGEAPGLHYLELGCGRGCNALVTAAANPSWRVTAIDFMPSAIAEARQLAAAAGLGNISFIEADLASFAETPAAAALPEVNVVSMHGVWSWVSPAVRAGIVRLLATRLSAGGLVHVSYNALPGLQGALALQRLVRDAGTMLADRSDRRAAAGMELARDLASAGARHLGTPVASQLLSRLENAPVAYLAHEFMNQSWQPCFHAEVAEALSAAKLDFVAMARLPENFLALMLTAPQIAVLDRFEDPRLRELIKDACFDRTLRHDVYVRGARRMTRAAQDTALRRLSLALMVAPERFAYTLNMPAGHASLGQGFYRPAVAALGEQPHRVGELIGLPGQEGDSDNPAEVLAMLAGTGQAALLARPGMAPSPEARRLNAALARQLVRLDGLNDPAVAASGRIGGGFVCRAVELFLIERITAAGGALDPGVWAMELAPDLPVDELNELRTLLQKVLAERQHVWQAVGVI